MKGVQLMFRAFLTIVVVLTIGSFLLAGAQNTQDKTQDKNQDKSKQATITKVDAKNGTVTVRMKDKNDKDVDKQFTLTGDIRYFDSTGKAAAIEIFKSGDDVLVVELEGRLKEMHHRRHTGVAGAQDKNDSEFLKAAGHIDLAEIKLGQLAKGHGNAQSIKNYGERIAADHTKMNQELKAIANTQGVTLPDQLDKKHQELLDQLSKLQGSQFDKTFIKDMISGHQQAISKFETQGRDGHAADVKAWADKWLPTLREHLKMANSAQKDVD
jgi:putative membrane protein